jgi:hypothetical protein
MFNKNMFLIALSLVSASAMAQTPTTTAPGTNPSCEQVKAACFAAQFRPGQWKIGKGLEADCVRPLMTGKPQPKIAALPLPTMNPALATALSTCQSTNPGFGNKGYTK